MRLGVVWFFGVLFVEIWSIIRMSELVGGLATFILLAAGFIFGLQLMRSQGINAMIKAAQQPQPNESPLAPLAEGVVKAFAGILLIIPGFFSDIVALIILLPFVRKPFARYLAKKGQFHGFAANGFGGGFKAGGFSMGGFGRPGANDDFAGGNVYEHDGNAKVNARCDRALEGDVIEGEVVDDNVIELKRDKKPKDPSKK